MNFFKGPLLEKVDSSKLGVINIFKEGLSKAPIAENIVALLFYGSRLFGSTKSDYDLDLILKTYQPTDFHQIRTTIEHAKSRSDAPIDFEVYYLDSIHIDENFTTGAQGCYFLYSWAYAESLLGSNQQFIDAAQKLPVESVKRDIQRKIINYFGRIQHTIINHEKVDQKQVKKNFARAIAHINLIFGTWGYEKLYGYSTDEIIRRELTELNICGSETIEDINELIKEKLPNEKLYKLINKIHQKYQSILVKNE